MTAQRLRQFSETYFGEHGGYAQQYLFHHARMSPRKDCRPRGHAERAKRSRRTP
jgi:3-methyladenine DNA glycosylase/8-oxoguanine DNA glycosylase